MTERDTEPWPEYKLYIGECCREWPLIVGIRPGSCGLCGEVPTHKRPDDGS